jgi:hypothetical protein
MNIGIRKAPGNMVYFIGLFYYAELLQPRPV